MSDAQDMSTSEARESHYRSCWEAAAAAGNEARAEVDRLRAALAEAERRASEMEKERDEHRGCAIALERLLTTARGEMERMRERCAVLTKALEGLRLGHPCIDGTDWWRSPGPRKRSAPSGS